MYDISFIARNPETALYQLMRASRKCATSQSKANANAVRMFLLFIIILSGDVNLNQGPKQFKYPCQICDKAVKWKQRGIACDICLKCYHIEFFCKCQLKFIML